MPLANTGQFFTDEQLTSTDLQNAVSLLASSFNDLVTRTMYGANFVIINGLTTAQSSTADNGVQVASGLAFQSGKTLLLSAQQGVNVLPGSYPNGTGLAADATYSRIDVVYIQYAQTQANQQTRTFNPPGQSSYTNSVYTELTDGFTLSVVHGTASSSPVAPSAPTGSVVLAQVTVPANATTITTSDITDETASYRNDGGRLALATNSLLQYVDGATLGTPSGFTLRVGANDYIKDNTSTSRMDIQGGSNGVNMLSSVIYSLSGTPIILQPTADATTGTHVLSLKNAAGTEYGWIDNGGSSNLNAAKLGGIAAADYFRTDSGAPNPQVVANPAQFPAIITKQVEILDSNGNAAGYLFGTSGGGWYFADKANSATTLTMTDAGDMTTEGGITAGGSIATSSVSASGNEISWTSSSQNIGGSASVVYTLTGLNANAKSFSLSVGTNQSAQPNVGLAVGTSSTYQAYNSSSSGLQISVASLSNGTLSITINNTSSTSFTGVTLTVGGMIL